MDVDLTRSGGSFYSRGVKEGSLKSRADSAVLVVFARGRSTTLLVNSIHP